MRRYLVASNAASVRGGNRFFVAGIGPPSYLYRKRPRRERRHIGGATLAETVRSPRTVAVQSFYLVAGFAQALGHVLGDHHRPVLASGAAERDRQIALPFLHVVR